MHRKLIYCRGQAEHNTDLDKRLRGPSYNSRRIPCRLERPGHGIQWCCVGHLVTFWCCFGCKHKKRSQEIIKGGKRSSISYRKRQLMELSQITTIVHSPHIVWLPHVATLTSEVVIIPSAAAAATATSSSSPSPSILVRRVRRSACSQTAK